MTFGILYLFMSFVLNTVHVYRCITCTVHRTVIHVCHVFAIASAGFFVLLASFAVQRKE